jgi:hypothetical protein
VHIIYNFEPLEEASLEDMDTFVAKFVEEHFDTDPM